jgi:hypothetical protein
MRQAWRGFFCLAGGGIGFSGFSELGDGNGAQTRLPALLARAGQIGVEQVCLGAGLHPPDCGDGDFQADASLNRRQAASKLPL